MKLDTFLLTWRIVLIIPKIRFFYVKVIVSFRENQGKYEKFPRVMVLAIKKKRNEN
jgi:hypothetical protein